MTSGTLTIAGTTTSPATNVSVWGTGLSYSQAATYNDSTWAQTNVALPNGSATYNASARDNGGHCDTNTVTVNLTAAVTFQYDANGNLTNNGFRSFVYDDENQLISVTVTNGVGNSTRSDFFYDGRRRRRVRVEYIWSGSAWASNSTTLYVYDGTTVLQERDGNNLPVISYTRGRDLSGSLQGAGGIGGMLARTDHRLLLANDPGASAYYHADASGNITILISTNQVPVARYLYDPFGNLLSQSGPLAAANLYRFSSKEQHLNSGLSYYLYRFYDPSAHRWPGRDPIEETGGINLYGFVGNNPLNRSDSLGLFSSLNFLAGASAADIAFIMGEGALAGAATGAASGVIGEFARQAGAASAGNCQSWNSERVARAGFKGMGSGAVWGTALAIPSVYLARAAGMLYDAVRSSLTADVASAEVIAAESELSGTALARQLGRAGEHAVGITGPKTAIQIPGSGQIRFPDALTESTLTEVKNVGSLSYTQQLRDFTTYSRANGLNFELWVRPTTELSGPLQQAIADGQITLRLIPGVP